MTSSFTKTSKRNTSTSSTATTAAAAAAAATAATAATAPATTTMVPDVQYIPADEMTALNTLSNQRLAYIHSAQEDLQKVRSYFHLPVDAYLPTNYARFLTHHIRPDVQLGLLKQRPELRDASLYHLDQLTRQLAAVLARITIRHRTQGRCGADPAAHVGRDRFDDFVRYYIEYLREDEERIVRRMMQEWKDGTYVPTPRDARGVPVGVGGEMAALWEWNVGQIEAAQAQAGANGSGGTGENGVTDADAAVAAAELEVGGEARVEEEKDGLEYLLV